VRNQLFSFLFFVPGRGGEALVVSGVFFLVSLRGRESFFFFFFLRGDFGSGFFGIWGFFFFNFLLGEWGGALRKRWGRSGDGMERAEGAAMASVQGGGGDSAAAEKVKQRRTVMAEGDADDEEDVCRICRMTGEDDSPLYYPCACSGSIKYVHQECLLQWLNHSNARQCEVRFVCCGTCLLCGSKGVMVLV
jgi:hypothetical protein